MIARPGRRRWRGNGRYVSPWRPLACKVKQDTHLGKKLNSELEPSDFGLRNGFAARALLAQHAERVGPRLQCSARHDQMDGALGVRSRNAAIIHRTAHVVLDLAKVGGKFLRRRDVDFENNRLILLNGKGLSRFPARIRADQGDEARRPGCWSHRGALEVRNGDETLIRERRKQDGHCGDHYAGSKPSEPTSLCILFSLRGFAGTRAECGATGVHKSHGGSEIGGALLAIEIVLLVIVS